MFSTLKKILRFSLVFSFLLLASTPVFAKHSDDTDKEGVNNSALLPARKLASGVGINYFNAFLRTLRDPKDTSYEAGFAALAKYHIPFVRFAACGFWPKDMALYRQDKVAYFARLDAVVHAAEKNGICLIPDLFWHYSTVPDIVGEPCNQWGNAQSKTQAWMRAYIQEVVTRYKTSPAIIGWEFGNEYNNKIDLPNRAQHRPPVNTKEGTPATRSADDDLTLGMLQIALKEFAKEVRKYDTEHFITSGNSMPRPAAWHNTHQNNWDTDTPEQAADILLAQNPDSIDMISVHVYRDVIERLPLVTRAAEAVKKPVFVGEFQVPNGPEAPSLFDI